MNILFFYIINEQISFIVENDYLIKYLIEWAELIIKILNNFL
jgi:hypothetical protein